MIITRTGEESFKIKTRDAEIILTPESLEIDSFVIDGPGEYERKNIFVEVPFEKTAFKVLVEEISILYPSRTKKFTDVEIEELDGVDLLFLPGGENDSMSLKDALELSATLEPNITIPYDYADIETLKKSGIEGETTKSAKISKATMPAEGNQIIFLEK
ncbi:MAG: MBL fold metallo-hydrolase [Candidatus Berkelbacteria bacterium]|nr:MBL fold metallo-hydrolase [Candidatus Berkelbacteria bacterium]